MKKHNILLLFCIFALSSSFAQEYCGIKSVDLFFAKGSPSVKIEKTKIIITPDENFSTINYNFFLSNTSDSSQIVQLVFPYTFNTYWMDTAYKQMEAKIVPGFYKDLIISFSIEQNSVSNYFTTENFFIPSSTFGDNFYTDCIRYYTSNVSIEPNSYISIHSEFIFMAYSGIIPPPDKFFPNFTKNKISYNFNPQPNKITPKLIEFIYDTRLLIDKKIETKIESTIPDISQDIKGVYKFNITSFPQINNIIFGIGNTPSYFVNDKERIIKSKDFYSTNYNDSIDRTSVFHLHNSKSVDLAKYPLEMGSMKRNLNSILIIPQDTVYKDVEIQLYCEYYNSVNSTETTILNKTIIISDSMVINSLDNVKGGILLYDFGFDGYMIKSLRLNVLNRKSFNIRSILLLSQEEHPIK